MARNPQSLAIDLDGTGAYHHAALSGLDRTLEQALLDCIERQRAVAQAHGPPFVPDPAAERHCSEQALAVAVGRSHDTSDIRTDTSLTNCVVFHTTGLPGSVVNDEVTRRREVADGLVGDLLRGLILPGAPWEIKVSGHFWYPPGSYMGWHTNHRVPGWRAYLTHAEEEGRSYFRYRDPGGGSVVTSWDGQWDLRVFRVDPARPLWHSVWSGTHRYSFGYRLVPVSAASHA